MPVKDGPTLSLRVSDHNPFWEDWLMHNAVKGLQIWKTFIQSKEISHNQNMTLKKILSNRCSDIKSQRKKKSTDIWGNSPAQKTSTLRVKRLKKIINPQESICVKNWPIIDGSEGCSTQSQRTKKSTSTAWDSPKKKEQVKEQEKEYLKKIISLNAQNT